jgi:hypothetical protein
MDPEDSTPQIEDRNIIEALASYSEFLLDYGTVVHFCVASIGGFCSGNFVDLLLLSWSFLLAMSYFDVCRPSTFSNLIFIVVQYLDYGIVFLSLHTVNSLLHRYLFPLSI